MRFFSRRQSRFSRFELLPSRFKLLLDVFRQSPSAAAAVVAEGGFPVKTVAEVIGVSRSNLIERMRERPKKRIGRPPLPDEELVGEIKAVIAATYGYRRVHAILSGPSTRVLSTGVYERLLDTRWTAKPIFNLNI